MLPLATRWGGDSAFDSRRDVVRRPVGGAVRLRRGLTPRPVFCVVLPDDPRDLVTRQDPSAYGVSHEAGEAYTTATSASAAIWVMGSAVKRFSCSWLLVGKTMDLSYQYQALITDAGPANWNGFANSAGYPLGELQSGGSFVGTSATGLRQNGRWEAIAATHYSQTSRLGFINGIPTAGAQQNSFATDVDLYIALLGGHASATYRHYASLFAVWGETLPAQTLRALSADPWQILEPGPASLYSFPTWPHSSAASAPFSRVVGERAGAVAGGLVA